MTSFHHPAGSSTYIRKCCFGGENLTVLRIKIVTIASYTKDERILLKCHWCKSGRTREKKKRNHIFELVHSGDKHVNFYKHNLFFSYEAKNVNGMQQIYTILDKI